ncbi:uncharacterized protein HMPREF1541_02990 [Cyphellophora europaea CBS 101466]|uniref:Semialdehyde dehydrogenase NAD-binding domain-containing protein n=1 Tax=Cyphellophora europaea (strain CBS 101466) TaxID=1220924 RepID=W2RXK8_CYPE1|nr:uncharacterized protein HMPREF1541_02990 [Cyphellophora europaea CBS 101466]ETN41055.1 hypothetical protein HMPREF1541_02990 [Cyphellophora europaea CBS 101466]
MSEIKSVAIAGASGAVGTHVLQALLNAGFQVTVLTRSKKAGAYDASVKVVEVDFTSLESLTAALQNIDAAVSTVAGEAIPVQGVLIDAAAAAGVKRFIPSEYGSCTTHPELQTYPWYEDAFNIRQKLQEKARAGKLTWTVVACGAFREFLFDRGMLLDFAKHEARLYDDGDNRVSSTSLANLSKAIVGVFNNLEETKNKIVRVSEVIVTQNQVLGIAAELRPDITWKLSKVQTSALLKEGLDSARAGDYSFPTILKVLGGTALAGDTYGAAFDETDNSLLGVKEMTQEDLKKLVASKLA